MFFLLFLFSLKKMYHFTSLPLFCIINYCRSILLKLYHFRNNCHRGKPLLLFYIHYIFQIYILYITEHINLSLNFVHNWTIDTTNFYGVIFMVIQLKGACALEIDFRKRSEFPFCKDLLWWGFIFHFLLEKTGVYLSVIFCQNI